MAPRDEQGAQSNLRAGRVPSGVGVCIWTRDKKVSIQMDSNLFLNWLPQACFMMDSKWQIIGGICRECLGK